MQVSDLERTVIDGLRQPEYCGGVTEVAKALWMRHQDIETAKLVDYALRLGVGAVSRRLGYVLDLYGIAPEAQLKRLRDTRARTSRMFRGQRSHFEFYLWQARLALNAQRKNSCEARPAPGRAFNTSWLCGQAILQTAEVNSIRIEVG